MAMHTDLPIHKVAFDLLSLATDVTRNIPRDFKAGLGAKVRDECIEVMVLIARANAARDKQQHLGLPIGNLSSQFFANVYLDALDQFVKHQLRCRYYVRYVDDFVLLHESPQQLNAWKAEIEAFLPALGARLNPSKTILQPVDRGVDFVGHVIKPWRRTTRKRSLQQAMRRTAAAPLNDLRETANSYFGLLSQASHSAKDRAKLARLILLRGHAVNGALTKTYPPRKP